MRMLGIIALAGLAVTPWRTSATLPQVRRSRTSVPLGQISILWADGFVGPCWSTLLKPRRQLPVHLVYGSVALLDILLPSATRRLGRMWRSAVRSARYSDVPIFWRTPGTEPSQIVPSG